jgi:hypothetical protein
MARIKIEDVIDYLDHDMKRALDETVKRHFPGAEYNKNALFRDFKRAVYRKCSTWETVPDHLVDL